MYKTYRKSTNYVISGQVICQEYNFLTKQTDVRDMLHEREVYGVGGDTRAQRASLFRQFLVVWSG